jgi:hypothetical protein
MKEPPEPVSGWRAEQAPRRGALLVMRAMEEPREPVTGRNAEQAPRRVAGDEGDEGTA